MTGMALSLNNPHPRLLRELPPTDSRLRPDQRELELGHTEEATSEKLRLEEKQRETRRIRKVCTGCPIAGAKHTFHEALLLLCGVAVLQDMLSVLCLASALHDDWSRTLHLVHARNALA